MLPRVVTLPALLIGVCNGCVCGPPPPGSLETCVEVEDGDDDAPPSLPFDHSGRTLPITGTPVADDGFATRFAACATAEHSLTLARPDGLGRVRFSWQSDVADLDVHFVDGDVTVDNITPRAFSGGSAFVISDADGLALGVDSDGFLHEAGDLIIEQGAWRGTGATMCGTFSTTNARVRSGDDVTEIEIGDEKDVDVDGGTVTIHAFRSFHLEQWACTDSSNSLIWSLARH